MSSSGKSTDVQAHTDAKHSDGPNAKAYAVRSKTADYTLLAYDWVEADATGGAFNLTLPAAPAMGSVVGVKKVDASANGVTIVGIVDGVTNPVMTKQWHSYEVIYDGSAWRNLRR